MLELWKKERRALHLKKDKIFLHICCAPCSIECINMLKENYDITGFWYNPNIHPYMEYKDRLEALKGYSSMIDLKVIYKDEYGLVEFTKNVIDVLDTRCTDYCYRVRLEETAKNAKELGYKFFTTTLLISPYQKHDKIKEIGKEIAKKYDIKFIYYDPRTNFRIGQNKARELNLYMQKYCGCVFSEEGRFLKNTKNITTEISGKD